MPLQIYSLRNFLSTCDLAVLILECFQDNFKFYKILKNITALQIMHLRCQKNIKYLIPYQT